MRKLLFFAILCLFGCDPYDRRLTVVNNSNKDILYKISDNDSISKSSQLRISGKDTIWNESTIVFSDSSSKISMPGRNGWEEYINEDCSNQKLRIFLFDKELISTVPWERIYQEQKYTKKYELTVEELKQMSWEVNYP